MSKNPASSLPSFEEILQKISELACQVQLGRDFEAIAQTAIDDVRIMLQTDRVLVYRFLANQDAVVALESVDTAWPPIIGQLICDPCLSDTWAERYRQGKITSVVNIHDGTVPPCHAELLTRLQVQANLVVPILHDERLWGLLIIHHCRSPREWQPLEVQYLQHITLMLSLALQQEDLRKTHQHLATTLQGAVEDIREQQAVLQERQTTETWLRRYERIVSATPDCVALVDRQYTYQVINQTYLNWNKKSYEEIVGHSVSELLGVDVFENVCKTPLDRCLAGAAGQVVEAWLDYADGQRRFTRAVYAPYFELDGTISGVVINVHDLTELKRAELENQSLRERLQFLVAANPAIIYSCVPWGNFGCTFVSDNITTFFGYTPTEFCADPDFWIDRLHPDDTLRIRDELTHLHEQNCYTYEYRFRHHDGHYCWVHDEVRLIRDAMGEPIEVVGCLTLIDDRKRAEAALRESEERYRSVITTMAEGIVVQQNNGQIIACNASAERILGFTSQQLMGKTPRELNWQTIREDGSPYPVDAYPSMLALRTGQPQAKVMMGICKGQSQITWISINAHPLFRPGDPSPYEVVTSFVDITELIHAEHALKWQAEQRSLLTAIAQHIRQTLDLNCILHTCATEVRNFLHTDRVIIFRFAANWSGIIIAESVANGWESILGMQITDTYFVETRGESYEQGRVTAIADIYNADLDPCHIDLLERMQVRAKLVVPILQDNHLWGLLVAQHCQAPRPWPPLEVELLQQLATQVAIAIQQSELYQQVQSLNTSLELQVRERTQQLQQALDFEALLRSITDRVRDSLDEGHILQSAVEALAQGLSLAACNTGIYDADQATSTIFYESTNTLTPIQGCTFTIATAPHAEVYPQLLQGQTCQFCGILTNPLRPDQRLLTVLAVPLVDDQGVLGDIWLFKSPGELFNEQEVRLAQQVANQCAIALRQSRLYQASQAQVKELERLSQLKDDFLSTVSHELRSPMSNIKMATQMLEIMLQRLGYLTDDAAPISRYFKVLREEEQREINLINDLLDLARLDAGTEPLSFTSIELQFYIPHLAETFAERVRQQEQQIVIQIPADLPPLTTDLPYLERVLTELVHNACKYTPAGETITISAQAKAQTLEIRFTNSGTEIPPEEHDRIFEKFYRIPNNDPWKHGGTGLGLALVRKIVERLNGTIRVESGDRQTTFILEFQR